MKNIYCLCLFILSVLFSLSGCADHFEGITPDAPEVIPPEEPGIQVNTPELLFDASGIAQGINIRVVDNGWKAYPGETCDWLKKIDPENGEAGNNIISVTLEENESMEERSTFIVLEYTGTGDTLHIPVKQYTHESKYNRLSDSIALTKLFTNLSGEDWRTPWDFKQPITTWSGLEFEEVRGEQRVTGINMMEFNLYGEFPNAIGDLRELKKLIIRGGSVSGRLPNSLTSLRKLEEINIPFKDGYAEWFLPVNMGDMKSLKILNIGSLTININAFSNLYKVTTLEELYMNKFDGELPEGISALINLKTLQLNNTRITALASDFGQLPNLQVLNLSYCSKLTKLCDNFGELPRLEDLNAPGTKLEYLPENFGNISTLTSLSISNSSELKALPESISKLKGITKLDLGGCSKLESLPESIGEMTQLTELRLSNCSSLQSLPESFGQLIQLTKIDLGYCEQLNTLPASIGNLTNVREIDLSSCSNLTGLPSGIGQMTNLTKFTFSGASHVTLPESFANLTQLEEFSCTNWSEGDVRIQGDLRLFANMSKLKKLAAAYNNFSGDLSILSSLPQLTDIDLTGNNLSATLDLNNLVNANLKTLKLGKNNLSGTLDGLSKGIALTAVDLSENKLTGTIPEDIDKCSRLSTLYLNGNKLTGNIPVAIANMTRITWGGLRLNNNNLSGTVPTEVINCQGWQQKWQPANNILPQDDGFTLIVP